MYEERNRYLVKHFFNFTVFVIVTAFTLTFLYNRKYLLLIATQHLRSHLLFSGFSELSPRLASLLYWLMASLAIHKSWLTSLNGSLFYTHTDNFFSTKSILFNNFPNTKSILNQYFINFILNQYCNNSIFLPYSSVKVTLRPTISRSLHHGVEPHLGLMTRY
jgi:hypothetical protein